MSSAPAGNKMEMDLVTCPIKAERKQSSRSSTHAHTATHYLLMPRVSL